VSSIAACKSDDPSAGSAIAATSNDLAPEPRAEPSTIDDEPRGPLQWLDPKANGVAWIDLPRDLSPEAIAAVFALPPRASALLQAPRETEDALHAVANDDPAPWFSGPALVTTSLMSSGPYVIRTLARPRTEFSAALATAGFQSSTTEGFEIFTPARAFGWRVVLLDETTVAFVPAREPGSGLSPLTAGRDMPASDTERELSRMIAEDSTLKVALYCAGPMLHFDVEPSMRAARLELRTFGGGGLDGRVSFEPESDVAAVASELGKRALPEENEQIRQLVSQVAYSADGPMVLGRLQVTATKIAALRAPR
jgi:hypothetical protein